MSTSGITKKFIAVAVAWSFSLTGLSAHAAPAAKKPAAKKANFAHLAGDPPSTGLPNQSKRKLKREASAKPKSKTHGKGKKSAAVKKTPKRMVASEPATSSATKAKEAKLKSLGVDAKKIKLVVAREKAHEAAIKKISGGKIPIDRKIMKEKLERSHAQWLRSALGVNLYKQYAGHEFREDTAGALNPYATAKNGGASENGEAPDSLFVPTGSKSIDFSEGGSTTTKSNEPVIRSRATIESKTKTAAANLDSFSGSSGGPEPASIDEGEPAPVQTDFSEETADHFDGGDL